MCGEEGFPVSWQGGYIGGNMVGSTAWGGGGGGIYQVISFRSETDFLDGRQRWLSVGMEID